MLDQTEHEQDIAKLLSFSLTMGDKQPAVVVIAGTSSGVGKSTVSLGLMALFRWGAPHNELCSAPPDPMLRVLDRVV